MVRASQTIDPTSSLREIRYYPRVIKYDICQEKRNGELCGSRKLESSPRCSICKNKENGKKVGLSIRKIAQFYDKTVFTLSLSYLFIFLPLFV